MEKYVLTESDEKLADLMAIKELLKLNYTLDEICDALFKTKKEVQNILNEIKNK
jgi:predicted transcriptional regulator